MNKIKVFLILLIISIGYKTFCQQAIKDSLFQTFRNNGDSLKLLKFLSDSLEKKVVIDSLDLEAFLDTVKSFIGTRYCFGGKSRICTDCSGLLYQIFKIFNIQLPHNSDDLAHYGKIILEVDSLLPGDLVFFRNTYKSSKFITHSGIYLGDKKFIHSSSKRGVTISSFEENYYKKHFVFGTRIF